MSRIFRQPHRNAFGALLSGVLLASTALPALAQDTAEESRLRKLEAEVRALQRKVFPGGDEKFFKPEITASTTGASSANPVPATSAVTDILTRMDALEAQVAKLTGQFEENSNRLKALEQRIGITAPVSTEPVPTTILTPTIVAPPVATKPVETKPAVVATPPSASRLAAVRAIEKPQTGDAGDDEYSYGFRLWDARFYPEAQQQLQIFVDRYPAHYRASWGRNLLGRAYLDDGKAQEGAKWFLQNYQKDKSGARAPDSLLYLAVAMKELKDNKRACIALAEFSETYAAEAAGRLVSLYESTRRGLTCSG